MAKKSKKEKSLFGSLFDTRAKMIRGCVIGAVLIIAIIALMIVEDNSRGKMVVKNNTDFKLEYVKTSFVDEEGPITSEVLLNDIEAGKKAVKKIEPAKLWNADANLEVRFKLEGNSNEFLTDVGLFNDNFDGKITISLSKTKDPNLLKLKIKAKSGFFSSRLIRCNEEALVDLGQGLILD